MPPSQVKESIVARHWERAMHAVIDPSRNARRLSCGQDDVVAQHCWYIYALPARFVLLEATVRASTYARATGSSAGYQAALKAVRQHPLWRDAASASSHIAYVAFDPLHEDVWYLFAIQRSDVAVEVSTRPACRPGGAVPGTEDVLTILLVSSGALPGLDARCVWGGGPVTVVATPAAR